MMATMVNSSASVKHFVVFIDAKGTATKAGNTELGYDDASVNADKFIQVTIDEDGNVTLAWA